MSGNSRSSDNATGSPTAKQMPSVGERIKFRILDNIVRTQFCHKTSAQFTSKILIFMISVVFFRPERAKIVQIDLKRVLHFLQKRKYLD